MIKRKIKSIIKMIVVGPISFIVHLPTRLSLDMERLEAMNRHRSHRNYER